MKNNSFRYFKTAGFLLISIIFIFTFASCKPNSGDNATSQVTTAAPEPLVFTENGNLNFKFITGGDKADDSTLTAYTRMITNIKKIIGVDYVKTGSDKKVDESAFEVLFGYTAYDASRDVYGSLNFNEYAVAVRGNKIVIAGYNSDALYYAATDFVVYIEQNLKDGRLEIPHDLWLTGTVKGQLFPIIFSGEIPAFNGFEAAFFSPCGDDFEQVTLTKTTESGFSEYKAKLEAAGFTPYADNKIADNLFATYTKGNITVHTYYINYSGETKIVISKDALLPSKADVSYQKKCEPTFTLLGCAVGSDANKGGLGCIIGLEDGTFIIIDGGYNTSMDARMLYSKLKELSPDKNNITVRAWFITHAHSDHYGNLVNFSKTYSKNYGVTVESFIYNFCNTDEQTQFSSSGSFSSVTSIVETYWKTAKVYKCLTGQVFKFAGCDMEVLYCMSDFLPKIIGTEMSDADKSKVDGNIQNVTVRFKIAGQIITVTGDASKVNVDEMCARYGENLKSDIITVPHHGHNEDRYRARNGTKEFYKLTDPAIVMWPASDADFANRSKWDGTSLKFEVNYYLLNLLNVKETIVAGDSPTTVTLPYNGK